MERTNVLGDGIGYVALTDVMGDDRTPARTARTSFRNAGKERSEEQDAKLTKYLIDHNHCYLPHMQVLTTRGWVRWDECQQQEVFLVPDPTTRTYRQEQLVVQEFDVDDQIVTFKNSRMSFAVTKNHRMWFKPKGKVGSHQVFDVYRADRMSHWGHFDNLVGYVGAVDDDSFKSDDLNRLESEFIGFYLGDGSSASANTIVFHLKKDRKKEYLRRLLSGLAIGATERQSSTYEDAVVFAMETPVFLKQALGEHLHARAKDKRLAVSQDLHWPSLFVGLVGSDAHVNEDRQRIEFSSASPHLIDLFELLATCQGYDAHRCQDKRGLHSVYAYTKTSLEARNDYFGQEHYNGKVYCTTTSTGLLAVRGAPDESGFVCGNSTPVEFNQVRLYMKIPIFVARQLVRHRTVSINEVSYRYVTAAREFYVPPLDRMQQKAETNKQGSSDELVKNPGQCEALIQSACNTAFNAYDALLAEGLAPELARVVLPCNTYTEWYWQQNLHNFLHMAALRTDPHAQWETRQVATAALEMVEQVFPGIVGAWRAKQARR